MKNKDKMPVFPPSQENPEGIEYSCPAAAWGDMTGLIPYSAERDGSIESYNELYGYLPGKGFDVTEDNLQNPEH